MENYTLTVYCACGSINQYKLNFPRLPLVCVRPLSNEKAGTKTADIMLCQHEDLLFNYTLHFAYNFEIQDWTVKVGCPSDELLTKLRSNRIIPEEDRFSAQEQDGTNIMYLPAEKFHTLLEKAPLSAQQAMDVLQRFHPIGKRAIALQNIAGIGIMPHDKMSCQHILFGTLPFGWYIDTHTTAAQPITKTNVRSFINTRTLLTREEYYDE